MAYYFFYYYSFVLMLALQKCLLSYYTPTEFLREQNGKGIIFFLCVTRAVASSLVLLY